MKNHYFSKQIISALMLGCLAQLSVSGPALAQTAQTGGMDSMPGMRNMPGMAMPEEPSKKNVPQKAKKNQEKAKLKTRPTGKTPAKSAARRQKTMSGMDHNNMPPMNGSGTMHSEAKPPPQSASGMKMDGASSTMPAMDHKQMSSPGAGAQPPSTSADMEKMNHAAMSAMPPPAEKTGTPDAMEGMQMGSMAGIGMGPMQGGAPPPNARDPDAYADGVKRMPMQGMDMADDAIFGRVLINELEHTSNAGQRGQLLDAEAWYGGDYNKVWFKIEAERQKGRLTGARSEAMWDRVLATHWSTQVGVRRDTGSGPAKTWLAAGVRGMAPYWFETEATAYLGSGGAIAARLETRYEVLFTQRLILQPKIEANLYSKDDALRGIGAGLSDLNLGLRLRYEVRRQFAPYIGISWTRKFGNTADLARRHGDAVKNSELVAGVRIWF